MFPLEFIITLCANITALLLAIVVVATVFTWRRRIHEPQWTFQSVLAQSTKSWVESQLCAPLAVTVRERMRGEYFRALRASMQPIVLSAACTPQSHPCFVLAERLKDGGGRNARWHPDFNGHDADISPELYDGTDELTQVAYEHRQGAIMWREHEAHYIVYAKDRVAIWTPPDVEWAPRGERERGIRIVGLVQFSAFAWPHPLCATQCDPRCDVWAGTVRIGGVCNALGVLQGPTYDRPALGSQKVIDPNQFVRGDNRWVPCEYRVGANGTPTLLGGERAHAQPELVDAVATPVLAAGLPLLAQLRRPGLLLQERTLQVVVKAQRTVVPPAHHENGESEDTGLWHADGQTEHVVAVILYCYHKDAALKGGEMEFADRSAMNVLGTSETVDTVPVLEDESVPHCTAPMDEGTLMVFSNYQMVHRVLSMVNESNEHEASRDFVALFVIDPLHPLVPARCHLSCEYFLRRALSQRLVEDYGRATVDLILGALV